MNAVNEIFDLPLALFPSEILQRLGYKGNQMMMNKVRNQLMAAMDEARELLHPKAAVRTYAVTSGIRAIRFEGTELTITAPEIVLWGCAFTHISVFALTLGGELDEKMRAYDAAGDESGADMLEAIGNDVLAQSCNLINERLVAQGIAEGYQVSTFCCPGNGGWDLKEKAALLAAADPDGALRVSSPQPDELTPLCSMVGIIGWTPFSI